MKEYIERDAIIEALKRECPNLYYAAEHELIRTFPAADVAPVVHAKWLGKKYNWENDYNPPEVKDSHYLVCSNCDHQHPLYNYNVWTNTLTRCSVYSAPITIPNYCPNCGAKMDGGK